MTMIKRECIKEEKILSKLKSLYDNKTNKIKKKQRKHDLNIDPIILFFANIFLPNNNVFLIKQFIVLHILKRVQRPK